jgi:hypothetical protein
MKKIFILLTLALVLAACAAQERPSSAHSFTQPRLNSMSDEESENFFEGPSPNAAFLEANPAANGYTQATQPGLR